MNWADLLGPSPLRGRCWVARPLQRRAVPPEWFGLVRARGRRWQVVIYPARLDRQPHAPTALLLGPIIGER